MGDATNWKCQWALPPWAGGPAGLAARKTKGPLAGALAIDSPLSRGNGHLASQSRDVAAYKHLHSFVNVNGRHVNGRQLLKRAGQPSRNPLKKLILLQPRYDAEAT